MNHFTADKLYELLPAIHRIRDAELKQGEPLKALIAVLAEQAGVMEEDIAQLYDNWFIETCEEWLVPYIGDLLGVRGLHDVGLHSLNSGAAYSQRARVANTIRYRRRKGTAAMLEQLARDTTGWNARAVEFFQLLATTQHFNHRRLHNHRTPDLRQSNRLELLNTAFDTIAHTAEVRHISSGRGRYNIPNIGLFLWRLQAYHLEGVEARAVANPGDGRYTFSPLGNDAPLFNRPQTESEITHLAEEINVPGRLRRRPLYDELEARRQTLTDQRTDLYSTLAGLRNALIAQQPIINEINALAQLVAGGASARMKRLDQLRLDLDSNAVSHQEALKIIHSEMLEEAAGSKPAYFGTQPVFRVFAKETPNGPLYELLPEEILICNLTAPVPAVPEGWLRPPTSKGYQPSNGGAEEQRDIRAAVDPVLGRLAFPKTVTPELVKVSYAYGFSGDVGGGPYDRRQSIAQAASGPFTLIAVSKEVKPVAGETIHPNLTAAAAAWNTLPAGSKGLIVLLDNRTYEENLTLNIPEGSRLVILAAQWPVLKDAKGLPSRPAGILNLNPDQRRPHLLGNITVKGTAPVTSPNPGALELDGLLVQGGLEVLEGHLGKLRLVHSTLVRDEGGLAVHQPGNQRLEIELLRCICGPIEVSAAAAMLSVNESIVDGDGGGAIQAPSTPVDVQRSTVFGSTDLRRLEAGNSIFSDLVTVERRQEDCVRFSYLPPKSTTPRRYRCQPDFALKQRSQELGLKPNESLPPAEAAGIQLRLVPSFSSLSYGHDAYAQLSPACAAEIRQGAEDRSEMGAFGFLRQPQRIANLQSSLDEYLRFGLRAGLILAT